MHAKRLIESLEDSPASRAFLTLDQYEEIAGTLESWDPRISVSKRCLWAEVGTGSLYRVQVDFEDYTVYVGAKSAHFYVSSERRLYKKTFSTIEQLLEIISQEFGL